MNSRFKKFLSFYKPYIGLFIADITYSAVVAGVALIFPLCIRYITKDLLEAGVLESSTQIYMIGLAMLGLVAIQVGCQFFYDYRGHSMGAMMERDMRQQLFEHYQKLSFGFYDEQKTGQLMSRLTNDLLSLTELYHHAPEDIIIFSLKFIGSAVILCTINVKLTLIALAFIPFMAVFTFIFNKRLGSSYKKNFEEIANINSKIENNLSGIRVVQSFSNEQYEIEKFKIQNNRFLKSRKRIYFDEAVMYTGVENFLLVLQIMIVVFAAISISKQSLGIADLLTFILYIGYLLEPIPKLTHTVRQFQEGISGFNRFMEIMELEPDIQDPPNAIDPIVIRGDIEFKNVSFRYGESYENVLNNISITAQSGDYIALVGPSGVGKTTICSLIPRFYDVQDGEILFDGVNIKDIKLDTLRKNIGIVQQDVFLFDGTVIENIRYGNLNATDEEVIEAAKKANAHEFIESLQDGYNTNIGQRGIKLSGGQKQRLSIARAFLKNPPVLIFDEATSSLDNESELVVQQSLEKLSENRTTFVIAHRLSTIKKAKKILVLTDDGISEQGTHEELIAVGGVYASLYEIQF